MQIRHLPPTIILGTFENPRSDTSTVAAILDRLLSHNRHYRVDPRHLEDTDVWDDELCIVYLSIGRLDNRNEG